MIPNLDFDRLVSNQDTTPRLPAVTQTLYPARMESPQFCYFEVSTIDDVATLLELQDQVVAMMREKIEGETGKTNISFTFRNLTERVPGAVVNNRWEARADFYSARMESPQLCYFEVSTIDSPATLQALQDKVAAKLRGKIEEEIGETNIRFTFRNLSEPRPGIVTNIRWEARAEF
jgi:predicted component of type VI protein secretion system